MDTKTDNENTGAAQSLPTQNGSGLGWRFDYEAMNLVLIFEVPDLAHDEDGKSAPAGVAVKIGRMVEFPAIEKVEQLVESMRLGEVESFPFENAKPITWEEYCEKGYDDNED